MQNCVVVEFDVLCFMRRSTVLFSVSRILFGCTPRQVFRSVIYRISVQVADLLALWTGAVERLTYKPRNCCLTPFNSGESNTPILVLETRLRLHHFPSFTHPVIPAMLIPCAAKFPARPDRAIRPKTVCKPFGKCTVFDF